MVARGDLDAEIGIVNVPEVQSELIAGHAANAAHNLRYIPLAHLKETE
jgi:pyruvate kinase